MGIEISDEQFANFGNFVAKFIKVGTLISTVLALVSFLGLIFVTVSPVTHGEEGGKDPDPEGVGFLAPQEPEEGKEVPALWITEFTFGEGRNCHETRTGIEVSCVNDGHRIKVMQKPAPGEDMMSVFNCEVCPTCDDSCTVANISSVWCTAELAKSCSCKQGCKCKQDLPNTLYYCVRGKSEKTDRVPVSTSTMSTDEIIWATLADIGYLFFCLAVFITELNIEQFRERMGWLRYWPFKVGIQLFLGVNLVNASTMAEVSGSNVTFVYVISLIAGWSLLLASLIHVSFNICFTRDLRLCKYLGMRCMIAALTIVIIGGVMGTTDSSDSDDS